MIAKATFTINYVQYLDHLGEIKQSLPDFATNNGILIDMYRTMVLTRMFDVKAVALQRTGKMGTYAQTFGQEAIGTALGHAMQPEDVLAPYYRDYAAQIQRGVKISELYNYWGGDERGSDFSDSPHDFPIAVPIASQCLHAAGAATAFKLKNQARVAVATIGDGGTSEGDFYEAINVAGAWQLPAIFVVNNNKWAISVPLSEQTATETIAQKAIAGGFEGIQVDGNDVIALRQVMGAALDKARRGDGPTLIEAITYRLSDHTTADDAKRYQPAEEFKQAEKYEPIRRLKAYLVAQNAWNETLEQQLHQECSVKVQTAVDEYLNQSPPMVSDIFDYHFATLPDYLIEQRASALEEVTHA